MLVVILVQVLILLVTTYPNPARNEDSILQQFLLNHESNYCKKVLSNKLLQKNDHLYIDCMINPSTYSKNYINVCSDEYSNTNHECFMFTNSATNTNWRALVSNKVQQKSIATTSTSSTVINSNNNNDDSINNNSPSLSLPRSKPIVMLTPNASDNILLKQSRNQSEQKTSLPRTTITLATNLEMEDDTSAETERRPVKKHKSNSSNNIIKSGLSKLRNKLIPPLPVFEEKIEPVIPSKPIKVFTHQATDTSDFSELDPISSIIYDVCQLDEDDREAVAAEVKAIVEEVLRNRRSQDSDEDDNENHDEDDDDDPDDEDDDDPDKDDDENQDEEDDEYQDAENDEDQEIDDDVQRIEDADEEVSREFLEGRTDYKISIRSRNNHEAIELTDRKSVVERSDPEIEKRINLLRQLQRPDYSIFNNPSQQSMTEEQAIEESKI
jgi:hypothetical protein